MTRNTAKATSVRLYIPNPVIGVFNQGDCLGMDTHSLSFYHKIIILSYLLYQRMDSLLYLMPTVHL